MAWIESHQELARHPKAKRLARELAISLPQAIGHLHLLWWWALDFAQDGDLSRYDAGVVADAVEWPRDPGQLIDALKVAGLLDDDSSIHDWDVYTGRLLERRRQDAERKRTSRGQTEDVRQTSDGRRTDGVRTVPNPTEPNRTEPTSLAQAKPERTSDFDRFWMEYPRKEGKIKARAAFKQACRHSSAEEVIQGARRYRDDPNREDEFTAHPTTWLNRGGWEDDPLPSRNGPKPVPDRAADIATGMWKGGDRGTGASRGPGGPAARGLPRQAST